MSLTDATAFQAISPGAGSFVFGGFISSFLTPMQAVTLGQMVDGGTYSYLATNDLFSPSQREWGRGVWHQGTHTFNRTQVLGTINLGTAGSGAPLNFDTQPFIFMTALAEDIGGGGGNDSGWLQVAGSPGNTHTTPINAPGGSGQAGPDILMEAGAGDVAGAPGNIHLLLPATGTVTYDPSGLAQITGVVLLDPGSNPDTNGLFIFSQPYTPTDAVAPNSILINAGNGDQSAGSLSLLAGSTATSGVPGNLNLNSGSSNSGPGGSVTIASGGSNDFSARGGDFTLSSGSGLSGGSFGAIAGSAQVGGPSTGTGGSFSLSAGSGWSLGGGSVLIGSGNDLGGGGAGNLTFIGGSGDPGGSLFFDGGAGFGDGVGGSLSLNGGAGAGIGGGGFVFLTGGNGAGGGEISLRSGDGSATSGGDIFIHTGLASGNGNGGDLTFIFGTHGGIGRDGLFFPNLPTTDPGVAGAAFTDGAVIKISSLTGPVLLSAPVTVAGLPAAGTVGRRAFVTNATVTTFASIVAGGGTNKVPVYDDGTNWRIG